MEFRSISESSHLQENAFSLSIHVEALEHLINVFASSSVFSNLKILRNSLMAT